MGVIVLEKGDICQQTTEAIVNAANTELQHGGGVAGAIVRAGGERIQEESNRIAPIPLGEAASEESVRQSIVSSFKRATALGVKSLAFPAIGAGIARFPLEQCAELSLTIARDYASTFDKITFVLYNEAAWRAFTAAYRRLIG